MDNILYLDDYINLYNKKDNKLIVYKPYKETLKFGHIINRNKFIRCIKKLLINYNLNNNFFISNIKVIINSTYSIEDKRIIQDSLEELNYKNIKFIQEISYLNVSSKTLFINCNSSYFYFYYLNRVGNQEIIQFEFNNITKDLFIDMIKLMDKKEIILYGKNYLEFAKILEKKKINYYYYDESDNLILKILLNNKNVSS